MKQWQNVTIQAGAKYRSPAVSGWPQHVIGWCSWWDSLETLLETRGYAYDNGRRWMFVKDFGAAGRYLCYTAAKNVEVQP